MDVVLIYEVATFLEEWMIMSGIQEIAFFHLQNADDVLDELVDKVFLQPFVGFVFGQNTAKYLIEDFLNNHHSLHTLLSKIKVYLLFNL